MNDPKILEMKVGYGALSVVIKELDAYIKAHTIDGRYTGEKGHLLNYNGLMRLVKRTKWLS